MTTPSVMTVVPKMSGLVPPSASPPTYESKAGGSRAQLAKAELAMYEAPVAPATTLGGFRGQLTFQFNPKELSITKSASWTPHTARAGEQAAGPAEFSGSQPSKLSFEAFFDASDNRERNVVQAVEQLFSCCMPTEISTGQKRPSPPIVVFKWGSLRGFPAYITSVSAKYVLFAPDGTPIRATAQISMDEMPGVTAGQNPTSGALAARREHAIIAGDTLASVAFREYGDAALWRVLADFNRIDDPLRLRSGTTILIPAVEELDALADGGR